MCFYLGIAVALTENGGVQALTLYVGNQAATRNADLQDTAIPAQQPEPDATQ